MKNMVQNEEKFIQLNKNNILKIGIRDEKGKPTGEHLEFDIESMSYPLKLNDAIKTIRKITSDLNMKLTAINKKQDAKGYGILTKNKEEEIKAMNVFYLKGMEALDLFFGENGCKKLLNGREPYLSMFNEFIRIAQDILPMIEINAEQIKQKIKIKYSNKEEENVLK